MESHSTYISFIRGKTVYLQWISVLDAWSAKMLEGICAYLDSLEKSK